MTVSKGSMLVVRWLWGRRVHEETKVETLRGYHGYWVSQCESSQGSARLWRGWRRMRLKMRVERAQGRILKIYGE